ncbi:MAG: O-antigen ligase family protein [Candidatus Falkowbacteria bacterium]|nr:O-antigen ligase family protein [Candidatus Falkowbacteria bacterium]
MLANLKKIQTWLLIIFLFTLPWQTRWIINAGTIGKDYWEYGTISLYASDILLFIIIILQLLNRRLEKLKNDISTDNLLLLVISIFTLAANIYFSLNKGLSLFHAAWIILALGLFIVLRQDIITRSAALLSFVSGAAVVALLGSWQFISQTAPAVTWLGLAQHSSGDLGASVIETMAPDGVIERWLRAYGSLDHPNMLGGLAALAIFFCLYLIFKTEPKNKKGVIIIAAFIFLTAGLIGSFSRTALIATGLAVIIYFIFAIKTGFMATIKKAIPLFIIGIIISALFALPYYYIFLPRLSANTRLEQLSTSERIAGYKESLPIIKQHLVIGSGLGTYGLALKDKDPKQLVWYYQPIHDLYLLILAEAGILGALLWLWFMLKNIISAWKKFPEDRFIISGTIIVLLCIGLFDHWLMSLHFGLLFSAAALGLTLRK